MGIRLNNVVIGGVVGRDPEMKQSQGGMAIAKFSIAVDNGKEKDTEWFDIVAFDKQATLCGQYVKKGTTVVVVGRLSQSKWEDKDGNKRTRVEIAANSVQLFGGKRDGGGSGGSQSGINDNDIPF